MNFRRGLFFAHLHNPKSLTPQLLLGFPNWTVWMSAKQGFTARLRQKQKSLPRESPGVQVLFLSTVARRS